MGLDPIALTQAFDKRPMRLNLVFPVWIDLHWTPRFHYFGQEIGLQTLSRDRARGFGRGLRPRAPGAMKPPRTVTSRSDRDHRGQLDAGSGPRTLEKSNGKKIDRQERPMPAGDRSVAGLSLGDLPCFAGGAREGEFLSRRKEAHLERDRVYASRSLNIER